MKVWHARYHTSQMTLSVRTLQVDLLIFDMPQDKKGIHEQHMIADKGVWHHQVHFLALPPTPWPALIPSDTRPSDCMFEQEALKPTYNCENVCGYLEYRSTIAPNA